MLFLLTNWRGIAAGAIVASLAAFPAGYLKGRSDGRLTQLQDTVKAYQARKDIDHAVTDLGAYDRCLELGGLPNDCKQLRGLEQAPKATNPGKSGGQ